MSTIKDPMKSFQQQNLTKQLSLQDIQRTPAVYDAQLRQAVLAVLDDCWIIVCWIFQDQDTTMFTCPHLDWKQKV